MVRTKEKWIQAAEEINADLNHVYLWGRPWNINFEPGKYHSLCVTEACITTNISLWEAKSYYSIQEAKVHVEGYSQVVNINHSLCVTEA